MLYKLHIASYMVLFFCIMILLPNNKKSFYGGLYGVRKVSLQIILCPLFHS